MAKKVVKRKVKKQQKKSNDDPIVFLGVLILILLLIAIGAYMFTLDATEVQSSGVLVTVNGQPITTEELDFQYNLLPESYKVTLTEGDILEQMINEELVVQAATAEGIVVTDEDVNVRVQEIINSGGLSLADLQENLEFFNVTMEEFEGLIRKQLLIETYTKQFVITPEPTEEDLLIIYDSQLEQYTVPEQATVQHILISNQQEDAAVLSKDIYDEARTGGDFCALVEEHSDDRGSIETCGEYTFPRGMMVPEFEEAGFEMQDGEYRLIQSLFGYHIMLKISHHEEMVQPFEDVRDDVVSSYESIEGSRQYQIVLSDLRDDAEIIYAGETEEVQEETSDELELPEDETFEDDFDDEFLTEDNFDEEFEDEFNELFEDDVEETDAEEDIEETSEEHEEMPDEEEHDVQESSCKEATLYGVAWSTDSQNQRDAFPDVEYVACDMEHELCESAGIQAYPSWVIGDELVLGTLTDDELETLMGCE